MGLLEDLKKQADGLRVENDIRDNAHAQRVRVVEAAMQNAFKYLHDLIEQLKVIKPVNPVNYQLPGVGEMRDLTFTDSSVDYRTQRVDNDYLYERVELYIIWSAATDLVIERDLPQQSTKVREVLWGANVRFTEEEKKNPQGVVLLTQFRIPKAVRMAISIRPDYAQARVLVFAKNLLRTGGDEFACPAEAVNETLLEDLARLAIGQPSNFRRYRTVLAAGA